MRFNPTLEINFDTSGVPPPIPHDKEWMFASLSSTDTVVSPGHEGDAGDKSKGDDKAKDAEKLVKETPGMDTEA